MTAGLMAGCLGLLAGCSSAPRPRPRVSAPAAPPERCAPGTRASSQIALPPDGCKRYLQGTAPLPLPSEGTILHVELGRLRADPRGRQVLAGLWDGIRAESMAAGQLLPYLRRCGVRPRQALTAITLSQPLQGRPDADRVVVFWGLLTAQRVVACLERSMEKDGARTEFLPAKGEPGFSADRPASDLHLDAVALNSATLIVASGKAYRTWLRRRIRGQGTTLATAPRYRRALAAATRRTWVLALAPRLPRRLPHVSLPADAHRHLRAMSFALSQQSKTRLRLAGELDVGQDERARRWARKAPRKLGLLALMTPAKQRPLLRRLRVTASGRHLRLHLALVDGDLEPLGQLVSRWVPW